MKKTILVSIISFSIIFGVLFTVQAETSSEIEELENRMEKATKLEQIITSYISAFEGRDDKKDNLEQLKKLRGAVKQLKENTKNKIEDNKNNSLMESAEDWRELSNLFLKNITLDNFTTFCRKARELKGPETETKEILSDDRDKIEKIVKKKDLYDSIPECEKYLNKREYIFVESNNQQKIELLEADTDTIRKKKIKYNKRIEEIMENNKIWAFPSPSRFFIPFRIPSREEKNLAWYFNEHCLNNKREKRDVHYYYCLNFPEGITGKILTPEKSIRRLFGKDNDKSIDSAVSNNSSEADNLYKLTEDEYKDRIKK